MPNRNGGEGYRYGFQGQEGDSEVKGKGNSINYKFRMHDPRVGRFFAVDPLFREYPHYSPYAFSGNKVIAFIELEGLEELAIPYVNNGDRGKIVMLTAEQVENIKNIAVFIIAGVSSIGSPDNSSIKYGVIFDGNSTSGEGGIKGPKMASGGKSVHINVADLAGIYGSLLSGGSPVKNNRGTPTGQTKSNAHSDVAAGSSFIKKGLDKGSGLVESVMKNVKEIRTTYKEPFIIGSENNVYQKHDAYVVFTEIDTTINVGEEENLAKFEVQIAANAKNIANKDKR